MIYHLNPTLFLYLVCYFTNLKYFFISEQKDTSHRIMKRLQKVAYATCVKNAMGKELPAGYFFGRKCVGYIDHTYEEVKFFLITTEPFYQQLVANDFVDSAFVSESNAEANAEANTEGNAEANAEGNAEGNAETKTKVKAKIVQEFVEVYVRKGTYKNFYYGTMRLNLTHLQPVGAQIKVLESVLADFKKKRQLTVFIHGVSNAGKSVIGFLCAKALSGKYCHTFNPTDPGDHLYNLIADASPTDENPLVIVLEEVDIILEKVHEQSPKINKDVPTPIRDKSTWCSFLDDMIFFKNVLLIMTSNKPKEWVETLDPAYVRKGRVHSFYSMPDALEIS